MEKGNRVLHVLDRYVGIPMTFVLGLFKSRKKNISAKSIKTIGILNPASIGDTVLLFGIIEDLKKKYPTAKIVFFSGESNYDITNLCRFIDVNIKLKISNPFSSLKKIRAAGKFDIWIDCMPWPRINAVLSAASNSDIKIGFRTKGQYKHFVYNIIVDHSDQIHELENLRNLVRVLGIENFTVPHIEVESSPKINAIVIHMFPSGLKSYKKEWPAESWSEVIAYLKKGGYTVYLTGGKIDKDTADAYLEKYPSDNVINVAGKMGLKDTIKLISSAKAVISVNTGIMHIAASLNINLVSLNGPTSVKRWGPINKNSFAIQSPHPDAPCLNLGFEYKCNNEECNCMAMITVENVISKLKEFDLVLN